MIESAIPILGEVLAGRYRLDDTLGAGGMGVVFRATDLVEGDEVAVKIVLPEMAMRADARRRFEREARVAAAFVHPNTVRILGHGNDGDRLYLVMELLHGQTLHDRLYDQQMLDIDEALAIASQMTDVLAAAHKAGLVHRDIKPSNFFLAATGPGDMEITPMVGDSGERLVMLDFGLAFLLEPGDEPGNSVMGRLTRDGHAGGTPTYMSPEQAEGTDAGPPSDVYSFGCLLFELIAGVPPFNEEGMGRLLSLHMYGTPPSLRQMRPDAPPALAELVASTLQKSPASRPSIEYVRYELAEIIRGGGERLQRARGMLAQSSRAERMVKAPTKAAPAPSVGGVRVAVDGDFDDDVRVELAVNNIDLFMLRDMADAGHADVIFAPNAAEGRLAELVAQNVPVITAADDMDHVTSLVRLGVTDALIRPVRGQELVRKVRRAVRRRRRSTGH